MLRNLPPLTRGLIIVFALAAIGDLFLHSIWVAALALHGPAVTQHFELWRLVTYPFNASIFSALGAGLITWFFGSELEQIVHTPKLAMMLAATVLLGGIIFILIDSTGFLYGPAMISVFLLTGFAYMWPDRQLSVMGMFWVKAWVIALVYLIIMLIPNSGTRLDMRASAIFAPLFAAVAAIVMFHLGYKQNKLSISIPKRATPKSAEDPNDPKSIEKRIDQILDKIASRGMASLSQEEKDFLLKNSKR